MRTPPPTPTPVKAKDFFHSRAVAIAAVALAGAVAGAIFLPSVTESATPRSPGTLAPGALAGAVIWLLLWLIVAALLSGRLQEKTGSLLNRTGIVLAVSLAPLISYLPYLIYRTGLEGDIATLPPLGTRPSAILLLIWSLLLLAALLRLTLGSSESRLVGLLTRKPAWTLGALMLVWLVVFFILDVTKLQYMQVTTVNSALFREAMLDVTDPRGFMWSNLLYDSGNTIFSVHINAIFLFLLPLFRIWPDYRWLLLISDVALALSAWPAYLIARRHFSTAVSLLIAAMLLLHPIMTAQPGLSDFSELRFLPVLFLTACYFFERKKLLLFAIAAFFVLTIREDMGLFVAFFGLYALVRRYPWQWVVLPLAAGLGWFVALGSVLLPRLAPSGTAARAALRYANLGSSGSEIAKTLLFKPWKAIEAAFSTPSHIGVAYGLFISFGLGIPLLSASVILAVPAVSELMFQSTTNLVNFMALPAVPALIFAYTNGLARFDRIAQRRWNLTAGRTAAIAAVFFFFLGLSTFHAWFNPDLYRPRYNYDAAREALAMVPEDGSVMMPEFMLAYGKQSQIVRGFHQIAYELDLRNTYHVSEDYVIVDRRIPSRDADNRYYTGLRDVTELLAGSPDYRKVYSQDDIELFVKNGKEPVI